MVCGSLPYRQELFYTKYSVHSTEKASSLSAITCFQIHETEIIENIFFFGWMHTHCVFFFLQVPEYNPAKLLLFSIAQKTAQ